MVTFETKCVSLFSSQMKSTLVFEIRVLFSTTKTAFIGGHRGQRCGGQIEYDPTLLPWHFHKQLQENHWCRLS